MSNKPKKLTGLPTYIRFLDQLKTKVQQAQLKAAVAVNSELIALYWEIGKAIVEKQEQEGWGTLVIEKLCYDLQDAFPGLQGFSRANIFKVRAFYLAYTKVSQPVRQLNSLPVPHIPWSHKAYKRHGKATTNL